MVSQDRIIGRLSGTDFRKFVLSVAMFMVAEAIGILFGFKVIGSSLFAGAIVLITTSGYTIETWLSTITQSPKVNEEINPNIGYMLSYIIPPLAATGTDQSCWFFVVSIIAFVLLISRIVWLILRREDAILDASE